MTARPARSVGTEPEVGTDPEAGAATVLAAGIVAVALALMVAVLALAQVQVARHTAQGAADMGALAAAAALQRGAGTGEACAVAERVVRMNGGSGSGCSIEGEEVVLAVEVGVDLGLFGTHDARASARAGPGR